MEASRGELAGLLAALTWAVGSLIFSTARAPASALNLFKNCAASLFFLVTLLSTSGLSELLGAEPQALGLLALSSLVGIVLGDTLYFESLLTLGPRRALLLTTLAPGFSAILGLVVLGETLGGSLALGMALVLLGVALAVGGEPAARASGGAGSRSLVTGIACGSLASLCQATGAVLSKLGMETMHALPASAVRIFVAAAAGIALAALSGRLGAFRRDLFAHRLPLRLLFASFCGTFLGIWLSLVAFKQTRVALAITLTSMSPIFVIPLARIFLGHPVRPRAVLGALLAVAGVGAIFGLGDRP